MLDAAVQVDLVGLACLDENLLALVALVGREDGVGLGGGDGQRALDGGELLLGDEGRVGEEAGGDAALVVADDVLVFRKAVSQSAAKHDTVTTEEKEKKKKKTSSGKRTLAPKQ